MGQPGKPVIIAVVLVVALIMGVGLFLVFSGQMSSYSFLMIGLAIGLIGAMIRLLRQ